MVAQSCLTLCNPKDSRPSGSSGHGILRTRILEWIAIPFSRGSFQPRDWTQVSYISCIGRQVLNHQLPTSLPSYQQCTRIALSLCPYPHFSFVMILMIAILTGIRWYLFVFLIYISLMIEHLFMCSLAICTSCLDKCPFRSSPHF